MHTFFLLSALLLVAVLSGLGAVLLQVAPPTGRRPLALVTLAAPPIVLALAVAHLIPHFWPDCAPLVGWDRVATFALLGTLGAVVVGATVLNVARQALVERLLLVCPVVSDRAVTATAAELAQAVAIAVPTVRLLPTAAPLAVSGGLWRPTIVLSAWLVEHLDRRELQAVLGHEMVHLARRDHLVRWLARLLRDATAYLPGSWYALQALEADEELTADALAVAATQRPLAMASALGKVWRAVVATPQPTGVVGVPAYAGASAAQLEERVRRLMEGRAHCAPPIAGRLLAGITVVSVGELAPRLLAFSATALPLVCTLRH